MSCQNGVSSLVFLLSVVPAFFPLSSLHFQANREEKKEEEEEEEEEYFFERKRKKKLLFSQINFRGFSKSRVPGLSVGCVPGSPFPFPVPVPVLGPGHRDYFLFFRSPGSRLPPSPSAVSVASAAAAAVVASLPPSPSAVSVASAAAAAAVAPLLPSSLPFSAAAAVLLLLPICLRCEYIFSPSSQSLLFFFFYSCCLDFILLLAKVIFYLVSCLADIPSALISSVF